MSKTTDFIISYNELYGLGYGYPKEDEFVTGGFNRTRLTQAVSTETGSKPEENQAVSSQLGCSSSPARKTITA